MKSPSKEYEYCCIVNQNPTIESSSVVFGAVRLFLHVYYSLYELPLRGSLHFALSFRVSAAAYVGAAA